MQKIHKTNAEKYGAAEDSTPKNIQHLQTFRPLAEIREFSSHGDDLFSER